MVIINIFKGILFSILTPTRAYPPGSAVAESTMTICSIVLTIYSPSSTVIQTWWALSSFAVISSKLIFTLPFEPVLAKTVNIIISSLPEGITGLTSSMKFSVTITESAVALPDTSADWIIRIFGEKSNSKESSLIWTLLFIDMTR